MYIDSVHVLLYETKTLLRPTSQNIRLQIGDYIVFSDELILA